MHSQLYFGRSGLSHYHTNTNTYMSWEVFVEGVYNGPMQGVLIDAVEHAEEVYACYSKEVT